MARPLSQCRAAENHRSQYKVVALSNVFRRLRSCCLCSPSFCLDGPCGVTFGLPSYTGRAARSWGAGQAQDSRGHSNKWPRQRMLMRWCRSTERLRLLRRSHFHRDAKANSRAVSTETVQLQTRHLQGQARPWSNAYQLGQLVLAKQVAKSKYVKN